MKYGIKFVLICLLIIGFSRAQSPRFDLDKDLLLAQFDCKTDVDDLHTVAALTTLLSHPDFGNIKYHAVAGTYGIQEGLYVPAEELFELAFGANWSDAHGNHEKALKEVLEKVERSLDQGGDIWVADAGQSDFSAKWIKLLLKRQPKIKVKERIHIVQHSNWNEEVTAPELLEYVKETIDYHKIPDGNTMGNGTPGFRSDQQIDWKPFLRDTPSLVKVWEMAISIGNSYNGKEGRYVNTSIASGGLDFSDLSEICYILGLEDIKDANEFFQLLEE
ncbi:hypothetical protein FGF1_39710 [Flavobacteriaceae bacterium GF1]